jgi:hypothetical protein
LCQGYIIDHRQKKEGRKIEDPKKEQNSHEQKKNFQELGDVFWI